jgi:methionyl aminopeptidase
LAILIKTPEQIEEIRKACRLAMETVKYLGQFAQPGITTAFIDKKCLEYVGDHGAIPASLNYKGFPGACCTSPNDVICHGVPGPYELRGGDILNIDVAVILNKFYGDTCLMFPIGEINEPAQKIIDVAKECLRVGIGQCTSGNHLGNIGFEINRYAKSQGCSVVYEFCGHGVGVAYHEEPEVSHVEHYRNEGPILKPGMIFTVEPMINAGKARAKVDKRDGWTARTIDGKLSAQFEHTILITANGPEVMTDIDGEFPKP